MKGIFKNYKFYFAVIFAAAFISLNAGYDPVSSDQDYLEAQRFTDITTLTPVIVPSQLRTIDRMDPGSQMIKHPVVGYMLVDSFLLPANPGPANNGGSAGWAIFFDLIAGPRNINVTRMRTASTAAASTSFSVEVFTRNGTALGGPVGSGPGSSMAGWTLIGTAPVVQGPVASGISEVFTLPTIPVPANDTTGVALRFSVAGPRYVGTGSGPYTLYQDTNLTLVTGDGRSMPFTPTGSFFAPRLLTGEIRYVIGTTTGINGNNSEIPNDYILKQNYPNPFNPSTTIEFAVPRTSSVTLKIYDANGSEVATLVNGSYQAGTYSAEWNAQGFASGVYFYSLSAENFSQTRKLVLIK